MEVCLGSLHDKPVMLELKDGLVFINGEEQPIRNITEDDIDVFRQELAAVPVSDDPGYDALLNSIRATFLVKLIGNAADDECISMLTHILDHVHYDVLQYLGETGE